MKKIIIILFLFVIVININAQIFVGQQAILSESITINDSTVTSIMSDTLTNKNYVDSKIDRLQNSIDSISGSGMGDMLKINYAFNNNDSIVKYANSLSDSNSVLYYNTNKKDTLSFYRIGGNPSKLDDSLYFNGIFKPTKVSITLGDSSSSIDGGIYLKNLGGGGLSSLNIYNTPSDILGNYSNGIYVENGASSSGYGIYINNLSTSPYSGRGIYIANSGSNDGTFVLQTGSGNAHRVNNTSSGISYYSYNSTGSGTGFKADIVGTGIGAYIISRGTTSTGLNISNTSSGSTSTSGNLIYISRTQSGTGSASGNFISIDDSPTTSGSKSGSILKADINGTNRIDLNPRQTSGSSNTSFLLSSNNDMSLGKIFDVRNIDTSVFYIKKDTVFISKYLKFGYDQTYMNTAVISDSGDMLRSTYDINLNSIVDIAENSNNSDSLNNQPASYYLDNTDDQTASEVSIADVGSYYSNSDVENALQEAGALFDTARRAKNLPESIPDTVSTQFMWVFGAGESKFVEVYNSENADSVNNRIAAGDSQKVAIYAGNSDYFKLVDVYNAENEDSVNARIANDDTIYLAVYAKNSDYFKLKKLIDIKIDSSIYSQNADNADSLNHISAANYLQKSNDTVNNIVIEDSIKFRGVIETPYYTETFLASKTINIKDGNYQNRIYPVTGATTVNLSNLPQGVTTLVFVQDATGYTITPGTGWGDIGDNSGSLGTTANARYVVQFHHYGSYTDYHITSVGN